MRVDPRTSPSYRNEGDEQVEMWRSPASSAIAMPQRSMSSGRRRRHDFAYRFGTRNDAVVRAVGAAGFTLTRCWTVVFFFASAGVSAAYLTVSEVFPMETRALVGRAVLRGRHGIGGIIGPQLFGPLIPREFAARRRAAVAARMRVRSGSRAVWRGRGRRRPRRTRRVPPVLRGSRRSVRCRPRPARSLECRVGMA